MTTSDSASDRLINQLCAQGESMYFESKRVSNSMVTKALVTICAFANAEGGTLALGVEDIKKAQGRARLYGIEENVEAVDELRRKIRTQFSPPIEGVVWIPISVTLGAGECTGKSGQVVLVRVPASPCVHSIVDDGTWLRLPSSNRQMRADEITELSFRRGVISAESEAVELPLELLDTPEWRAYCGARGLTNGDIGARLERVGLAKRVGDAVWPTRAAALLFAEYPSDVLAGHGGTRAGIRVFHYAGNAIDFGPNTNLKKPPRNIVAPLAEQITAGLEYVVNEIAQGLTMSRSGFATVHKYPERVIKEAITNAVLHRDYRYGRDIAIRIFDNRIEVESPGDFPANITPATIEHARSRPRNPAIVNHIREFPNPPNVDAGEGVPMMFATMRAEGLYPPQYSVNRETAVPCVTVTLLNESRPAIWEQVSGWIDLHGDMANRDLRVITGSETLEATRMLKGWVESGLLVKDDSKGKRGTVYRKPGRLPEPLNLFSEQLENKPGD